jgi:hypothetical protein
MLPAAAPTKMEWFDSNGWPGTNDYVDDGGGTCGGGGGGGGMMEQSHGGQMNGYYSHHHYPSPGYQSGTPYDNGYYSGGGGGGGGMGCGGEMGPPPHPMQHNGMVPSPMSSVYMNGCCMPVKEEIYYPVTGRSAFLRLTWGGEAGNIDCGQKNIIFIDFWCGCHRSVFRLYG